MIHVCDIIIDIVCYISIRARFIATAAICGTVGRWVGGWGLLLTLVDLFAPQENRSNMRPQNKQH